MLPLVGAAVSALAGGGAAGGAAGALGGILGGGAGGGLLGQAAGGILNEVIGDVLGGGDGAAKSNPLDPVGGLLGLPSPLELLQQGPSALEQALGQQSPLDMILGGGQGGGQGPLG